MIKSGYDLSNLLMSSLELSKIPTLFTDLKGGVLFANKSFNKEINGELNLYKEQLILDSIITNPFQQSEVLRTIFEEKYYNEELTIDFNDTQSRTYQLIAELITDFDKGLKYLKFTFIERNSINNHLYHLQNKFENLEAEFGESQNELIKKDAKTIALQQETAMLSTINLVSSAIAHELSQPLNVLSIGIGAITNWLENAKGLLPQTVEKILLNIATASAQINKIVYSLRNYSADAQNKDEEELEINSSITSCYNILTSGGTYPNSQIKLNLCDRKLFLTANLGLFEIIINNLISNALQATKEGEGIVQVSTFVMGNKAEIIIEDNGPGIDEKAEKKLFNPYFTTKSKYGGTGIGLAITRIFVEKFGGKIKIDRSKLGGAKFTIFFPIN